MANIAGRVTRFIADELGWDEFEVTPESRLIDDLGADSLDVTELAMRLGDEFDVYIPDDELGVNPTVQEVINAVEALLNEAA